MKLYTYFRSSAAYRVRIALNLKGLPTRSMSIHLTKDGGQQHSPEFRAVNPQMRVPALALDDGEVLTQSLAIIEYLDEIHPEPPLLPADPSSAPRCAPSRRSIACDIHPLNNLVAAAISQARAQARAGRRSTPGIITGSIDGFAALEAMIAPGPMPSARTSRSPTSAWCRRSTMRAGSRCRSTSFRRSSRSTPPAQAAGLRQGAAGKPARRRVTRRAAARQRGSHSPQAATSRGHVHILPRRPLDDRRAALVLGDGACRSANSPGGLTIFEILAHPQRHRLLVLLLLLRRAAASCGRMTRRGACGLHLLRNIIHYASQYAWALALTLLPLATVFALEFTMPAWTALLAVCVPGRADDAEPHRRRRPRLHRRAGDRAAGPRRASAGGAARAGRRRSASRSS